MSGTLIDTFDFEHKGRQFVARVYHDDDMGAPWKEHDGHGDIREVRAWNPAQANKRAGEVIIHTNAGTAWLYDFAGTMKKAKAEGWRAVPEHSQDPSPAQVALEAVRADMKRMAGWLKDEWHWCGVSVARKHDFTAAIEALQAEAGDFDDAIAMLEELNDAAPEEDYSNALWGIESDSPEYWREVANELADEIE